MKDKRIGVTMHAMSCVDDEGKVECVCGLEERIHVREQVAPFREMSRREHAPSTPEEQYEVFDAPDGKPGLRFRRTSAHPRGDTVNAEMLRRAAEACRNAQKQMTGRTDWFSWVAQYLDREAERLESDPAQPTPVKEGSE